MSSIEDFVKEKESVIELPEPPVRFSVNLDYTENYRLQYLAKRFGMNRASLASQFLELAINDAEKALGLNPFDFKSEYSREVLEHCGGCFYQDETGYYRTLSNGDKVKLIDANNEDEVDYSLGFQSLSKKSEVEE